MGNHYSIDPITRLEGHGKIEILLDNQGNVDHAYFQVPELRGFEKFAEGRPAEDMPQITSRICGVCPSAHHMAATKALDGIWGVTPTQAARLIRELYYHLFMFEDHLLHFFFLGGPDFLVGPTAPKAKRNILGVIEKFGLETGKQVIEIRKRARKFMEELAGKAIHPVLGLPGGVSKAVTSEVQAAIKLFAQDAIGFTQFTLGVFEEHVLKNPEYKDLILSDAYTLRTHYMGMVDEKNRVAFYDGHLRVVDPNGMETARFHPSQYAEYLGEHVESWSYIKFPFLKKIGWKGLVDGPDSGLYRVSPIARLNASDGMATPLAQAQYERFYQTLGPKPVHYTLAIHWARLIEVLYAAEKIVELANHPEICSTDIRNMNFQIPKEGVGVVEAPRGTLFHHYATDEQGRLTRANLIVASEGNAGAMSLSIEKAAKALIKGGKVDDGLLNMIEMAFRAYDPCLACATHSLPGKMPLEVHLHQPGFDAQRIIIRDWNGQVKTEYNTGKASH